MEREPDKRRLTWFTKPRPSTLGQIGQRRPRGGQGSDAQVASKRPSSEEPASPPREWQPLPPLPKWPPLIEDALTMPVQSHSDNMPIAPEGAPPFGQQAAPLWDVPDTGGAGASPSRRGTLGQRFRSASRRQRVGIAAGAAGLLLCALLSVAILGGALRTSMPSNGSTAPGIQAGGQTRSPTTGTGTPSVSATRTMTPVPSASTQVAPFTITFTCASGTIGGTGTVCVHTQPNAMVSLTVRYCDGKYAGGKSLRGTAHTDRGGDYTWRWDVTTRCAGEATATVSAKSASQTVTQNTTFMITN